ncbi:cytochrome c biogenesis protein CcdC [Fictibacillus sp. Mic-4]|uniref:CcdC family protein n=1 Tax=Fictibacillus TaxID=1329200 RepID=UPI000684E91C|nr:cytochrome c biogenesis protein CcdC [Fictibacillus gelatini]
MSKEGRSTLVYISTIFAAFMAMAIIVVRLKATKKPASLKKIALPPFFMATGFCMFLLPEFHVTWAEVGESFLLGCFFSIFLIATSKFEKRDGQIYLVRSKAFIFILIGLFLVRMAMKIYFGHKISYGETAGMFFLIAFGMILPWRIAMVYSFLKVKNSEEKLV